MPESLVSEIPESTLTNATSRPRVVLKQRKAMPFFGRHPWVYDSAIQFIDGEFTDGDVVELVGEQGRFIARGIVNTQSKLVVRLYSWSESEQLDAMFWRRRIERAIQLRRDMGFISPERATRLIFSEADGLSGLIVDQYGEHLVVQVNALAIARRAEELQTILIDLLQPKSVLLRGDKNVSKDEGMEPLNMVWGSPPDGPVLIDERGLRFGVDLAGGQKTGFYLDQAENRFAAAKYFEGRRVLDLFCYTGGFALAAARHGKAADVLGVDGSDRAIVMARANAERNGLSNVRFEQRDAFEMLDELRQRGEKFGGVVLDPPKFARNRRQVDEALRAYHRINRVAVDLLEPGGFLVTGSCSGGVSREDFCLMLAGVAQKCGRDIQIVEQRGAAADHPTSVTCLETDYLKCFICRVS